MNLVQIQERLKDIPTQAVMAYANGLNKDVPPYLALLELNRRKRAQQEAPVSAPQETVKDEVENQVSARDMKNIAANQMQAQGIAAMQPQMQPQMQQPAPEPMSMADGGVATLNVPDDMVSYGSGGVVAFANGELVEDVYGQESPGTKEYIEKKVRQREEDKRKEEEARQEFLQRAGVVQTANAPAAGQRTVSQVPEGGPTLERTSGGWQGRSNQPMSPELQRFIESIKARPDMRESEKQMIIADAIKTGNVGSVSPNWIAPAPQPVAQAAAPVAAQPDVLKQIQALYPAPAPGQTSMMDLLRTQATAKPPTVPELLAQRAEAEKAMPYLGKQPGSELEKYLAQMASRKTEERTRFEEMEKDRARAALWKSLIAAGEATRGQRGIGALAAGFGKTAGEEMEAARGRETEFRKAERERDLAVVKMKQEIENARIAQANGDYKRYQEAIEKAKDAKRKVTEKGAELEQRDREAGLRMQADAIIRGMSGEQIRMAEQYARSKGIPFHQAVLEIGGRGNQFTFEDALKMARNEFKDQNPMVWEAMEKTAAQKEGRKPRKLEEAITDRAKQMLAESGQGIATLPAQTTLPPGVKVTRER